MVKLLSVVTTAFVAMVGIAAPGLAQPPTGGRIRVVLIGEDRVPATSRPYMRSTMTAAFEDALVQARRFDVISPSVVADLDLSTGAPVDANSIIHVGRLLQAKYVVVVRQLMMNFACQGIFFGRPTLYVGL